YIGSRKSQAVDNQSLNVSDHANAAGIAALSDEPLSENAYANVNELMSSFCTAMADGDMDTVKAIKVYNTDKEIITYKEHSEFIESYDNINCYTKPGIEDNTYFVYVTYDVKFKDIETKAPGLNAFYVYTAEDGNLKIDGDTEESTKAAFKLVTSQDDVVDLYNKINVSYNEAIASDEALDQFMEELPTTIRTSVGVALAQLESGEATQTEADSTGAGETQPAGTSDGNEEPRQNQVVNQIVRTTDTVNVRSSDSEEADRIGKAQAGTELKRVEERINGWSKVIFEDREAYIKSDYLEVVTTDVTAEPTGTVTATTNVNVRSQASQESERLGSAQEGNSYNLLEDQGEWYKIDYNGTTGFVKAEFFVK
ncbi:MAG: SH3 domain-containing protein, partial [Lachnospiraceae bacterium]|nr:SH3 domain-containing protein [Lachnospiraceae bacterium]